MTESMVKTRAPYHAQSTPPNLQSEAAVLAVLAVVLVDGMPYR
jgi:hypothetical protein